MTLSPMSLNAFTEGTGQRRRGDWFGRLLSAAVPCKSHHCKCLTTTDVDKPCPRQAFPCGSLSNVYFLCLFCFHKTRLEPK